MAKQTFHVCYHCKDRKLGCHSNCERYLKEKEENDKRLKEKNKQSQINVGIYSCASKRINSIAKSRHKK